MSPDVALAESYRRTTFRVTETELPIDIRIGSRCPKLDALLNGHQTDSWAFITAWNPASKKLDIAENRRRQSTLEAEVRERGYTVYRGAGVPDDEGWEPEESVLVVGINREEAVKFARRHGQAAIVAGRRGANAELVFII